MEHRKMKDSVKSIWTRRVLATLLAVLGCAVGISAQALVTPPVPFEDVGACPFEGCVYRDWTARAPVQVLAARRADASEAFQLRAGERVTAVTGVVVTLRAGRVQFDVPERLMTSAGVLEILPSQTLYLLTYQGEGFITVWFNGTVYRDVDAASFMNGVCEKIPSRCTGRVLEHSRTEWWVQVRNKAGQVGWTRQPEKFDGKNALR